MTGACTALAPLGVRASCYHCCVYTSLNERSTHDQQHCHASTSSTLETDAQDDSEITRLAAIKLQGILDKCVQCAPTACNEGPAQLLLCLHEREQAFKPQQQHCRATISPALETDAQAACVITTLAATHAL